MSEPYRIFFSHGGEDTYIVEHFLEDRVRFRNLTYPEVEADFHARGGRTAPALWDGTTLYQGAEAVVARLQAVVNLGRDR